MGENLMRNGGFFQRDTDHLRASELTTLSNCIGNFPRLPQTHTYAAALITYDDQRAKVESASTFDDFGGPIDKYDLFGQFLFLPFQIEVTAFRVWSVTSRAKA